MVWRSGSCDEAGRRRDGAMRLVFAAGVEELVGNCTCAGWRRWRVLPRYTYRNDRDEAFDRHHVTCAMQWISRDY